MSTGSKQTGLPGNLPTYSGQLPATGGAWTTSFVSGLIVINISLATPHISVISDHLPMILSTDAMDINIAKQHSKPADNSTDELQKFRSYS